MADTFSSTRRLFLFTNLAFIFLLLLSFSLISHYLLPQNHSDQLPNSLKENLSSSILGGKITNKLTCNDVHHYNGHESKCRYVKSHPGCDPQGFINYLHIFYCSCGRLPLVGYFILFLWLALLFYLLGDTAATYFCSSLEDLSRVLTLSPTIAGVTLLPLGNGAPDVFASVASFTRSENGGVGINSVLGGAFFVSSFVVGVICLLIDKKQVRIDDRSFVRDTLFLLLSLSALLLIVFLREVTPWLALCFVSIYFLFVGFLCFSSYRNDDKEESHSISASSSCSNLLSDHLNTPFLNQDEEKQAPVQEKTRIMNMGRSTFSLLTTILRIVDLPLDLPRRLTIPVISDDKWSKPYAIASVTIAPIFLCSYQNLSHKKSLILFIISAVTGVILGSIVFIKTKSSYPPKKCLLPWLIGGFIMSITWTYVIAQELVSLLVSLGTILAINPSVLGLTILAWGNSLGDFITNATMAVSGGPGGAQMALAGCYAGPMFNTLVGLGVPLVLSSMAEYPQAYTIPSGDQNALYETIGFLIGGLLWTLVVLPKRNMKPDKLLGGGLLAMYFCFLFLILVRAFGTLNVQ